MADYYKVCSACNDIIHEDVVESCKKCYCKYCFSCSEEYGRFVKPKCQEGDSCEVLISVGDYHDTSDRTSSCDCTDSIQAIRKRLTETSFVCYTCLSVKCPDNRVFDSQVIDFLLKRSIYKSVDQVKEIIFYRQKTPYAEIKFLLLLKTRPTIFNNLPIELRRVLFEFLF